MTLQRQISILLLERLRSRMIKKLRVPKDRARPARKLDEKSLILKGNSTKKASAIKLLLFSFEENMNDIEKGVVKQISNTQLLVLQYLVKFELQDNGLV